MALAVAAMATRSLLRTDLSGISVAAHPAHVEDLDAMASAWNAIRDGIPADEQGILDWCLAQALDKLMSVMAILVAGAIDLTHEKESPADRRRLATSDTLANAVDLDMTRF